MCLRKGLDEATISSPLCARVSSDRVIAACPEAVANAPTPPSNAAILCSKTSVVGFIYPCINVAGFLQSQTGGPHGLYH